MKNIIAILAVLFFFCIPFPVQAQDINLIIKKESTHAPKLPSTAFLMPDKTMVWKLLSGIGHNDYSDLVNIFAVMKINKSNHLQILLNSPGGSLFDGMALAGLIQEKVREGMEIEIRGYGVIASAATLVLVSGSKGKRFLDANSLVMIHELSVAEFLSIKNVSEKEKEVVILRMIQNNVNRFLCQQTGVDTKELYRLIREETWFYPSKAVDLGFADKIL